VAGGEGERVSYLDGVQSDLGGFLGQIKDDPGAVLGAHVAFVSRLGHAVQIGSARVQRRVHVGHLALQQLSQKNEMRRPQRR